MNLPLTSEHVEFLEAAIASGVYKDESDALNQAITLLQRRDALREALQIGERQLDQGQGIPSEAVFARLELKAAELDRTAERP